MSFFKERHPEAQAPGNWIIAFGIAAISLGFLFNDVTYQSYSAKVEKEPQKAIRGRSEFCVR